MDSITVPTTFTAAWIIVLALVATVIQAIVNQPAFSAGVKRAITVGLAAVLGTLYMIATGAISVVPKDVQDGLIYWFVVIAGIIAVGQVVYNYLKPYLTRLEVATSPDALSTGTPPKTDS